MPMFFQHSFLTSPALAHRKVLLRFPCFSRLFGARFAPRDAAGMTCTTTSSSLITTRATFSNHSRRSFLSLLNGVKCLPLISPKVQLVKQPEPRAFSVQRSSWLLSRLRGKASLIRSDHFAAGQQAQARSRRYAVRAMLGDRAPVDAPTGDVAPSPPPAPAGVTFVSSGEDATGLLAQLLVQVSKAGDVICLYGRVGAGKSVFSRAFIRAVAGDPDLVVPSPTFLLQQVYEDHPGTPVHHFDLYRLTGPTENFERLGMEESYKTAISLIEWPECLGDNLPDEHLNIHIDTAQPQTGEQVVSVNELAQVLQGSNPVLESPSISPTATSSRQDAEHSDDDSDVDDFDGDATTDEKYSDKRPRRFVLNPHGQSWARRLEMLLGRKQS